MKPSLRRSYDMDACSSVIGKKVQACFHQRRKQVRPAGSDSRTAPVMDGLSSIRPEIEAFVSRENRSHADPWLQQANWVEHERTLKLYTREPPRDSCEHDMENEGLLATLASPSVMEIYFPASLNEKPFCFCKDDALVPAAEAANQRLRPLSCNSVLAVVTAVLQCVKRDAPIIRLSASSGAARAFVAAEMVLAAIKEDPAGADIALALVGIAVSSYRRDTVSSPFPKQLESKGFNRSYAAFALSLEGIPSMTEMSEWTEPKRLLQLSPKAVLVLHFVLVFLPIRLRSLKNWTSSPPAAVTDGNTFVGSTMVGEKLAAGRKGFDGGVSGAGCVADGNGVVSSQLGEVPSHVFKVLLPSDPAFEAEARRGGYSIAYHGSSAENFHSILNTGLRVMSDSRLMKNGAAFGNGIYLSGSCKAAVAFAKRGDGTGTTVWPRSAFGGDINCSTPRPFRYRLVAKCHVLNGHGVKEIKGWGDEQSYFVVSDGSRIRVEHLLLFYDGQPADEAASAQANEQKRAIISGSVQDGGSRGSNSQGEGRGAGEIRRGEGNREARGGKSKEDEDPWAWADPLRDPVAHHPLSIHGEYVFPIIVMLVMVISCALYFGHSEHEA